MGKPYYHEDVESLIATTAEFTDEMLEALVQRLSAAVERRKTLSAGLDSGETLQFDLVFDMIKERTKLSDEDALRMIREHPKATRKK